MMAERFLIGAILCAPEYIPEIRNKVSLDDFFSDELRALFRAACDLTDNGEPVDPVTILRKAKEGGTYVSDELVRDLMLEVPASSKAPVYANELAMESSRWNLREKLSDAVAQVDAGIDLYRIAADIRTEAAETAERISSGGATTSMEAMLGFNEYRRNLEKGGISAVVSSGYSQLDNLLGGGFAVEGLYILAARPGVGKTTFGLNIAEFVAMANSTVLFVSLEMSTKQLSAKRIANATGISSTLLLNDSGKLDEGEWKLVHDSSSVLAERPLFFNREKHASVSDIDKLASKQKDLKLVVVDYLGLVRHTDGKSLYERVTFTSGALKRMARSLGVPVLCLAQLNREVEGRREPEPRMSDLRDSGAIEQDADGVILLHRYATGPTDTNAPALLKVILAKNRHGPVGSMELSFYLRNGRVRQ